MTVPPLKSDSQVDMIVFKAFWLCLLPTVLMSNEIKCKLQLYNKFKCNQWSQEAQKLLKLIQKNTLVTWTAMTKKQ